MSLLSSQYCPAWCKEKTDAAGMPPQLSHPYCSCIQPLTVPLTMALPTVPFQAWATRLHSSETKLDESLILEVHATEIGLTMFFHNYPQSLSKYSTEPLMMKYLWDLGKPVVNWFALLTYLPKNCLLQIAVFSKSKVLPGPSEKKALSWWRDDIYTSQRNYSVLEDQIHTA